MLNLVCSLNLVDTEWQPSSQRFAGEILSKNRRCSEFVKSPCALPLLEIVLVIYRRCAALVNTIYRAGCFNYNP